MVIVKSDGNGLGCVVLPHHIVQPEGSGIGAFDEGVAWDAHGKNVEGRPGVVAEEGCQMSR